MATVSDFRSAGAFNVLRVGASGRTVGKAVYWKLFAIENVTRVIVHSVLSAQIGANWWSQGTDPKIQKKAQGFPNTYTSSPWHSTPG